MTEWAFEHPILTFLAFWLCVELIDNVVKHICAAGRDE